MNDDYSNREIDRMQLEIMKELGEIKAQTTKHNGRMTRMEKIMLVVGTVVVVLLVVNGSSFISFLEMVTK